MNAQQTDTEVSERVAAVFRQTFGKKAVFNADLNRTDLALWTSMKHIEFIIGLEKAFGVRFDGADATDMVSIPVVLDRLRRRLK
jgi:acyl carrier protein